MSVPEVVFAALGPLVAGRCTPNRFPQRDGATPTWPAIRYVIVSEDPDVSQCGTPLDADDTEVQIDIVADTYAEMRTLKAAAMAALQDVNAPPCHRLPGGFEVFDEDTRTHRGVLRYLFQQSSP